MSHRATNWAIQQRGLEPAAKLLLWQLADRHNADTGRCDPSQERLAEDCEMSRASVNRHLKKLEEAGLIRRVQRVNEGTKRQERTFYLLAFDNDFSVSQSDTRSVSQIEGVPCLKSDESRVSNCDTNPVREPGKEPAREADLFSGSQFDEFWASHPKPRNASRSRELFDQALKEGHKPERIVQAARAYGLEKKGTPVQYIAASDNWLQDGRWADHDGKAQAVAEGEPGDSAAHFWARKINEGRFVSPSAINARVAREMIEGGLVTVEQLRAVGVAA